MDNNWKNQTCKNCNYRMSGHCHRFPPSALHHRFPPSAPHHDYPLIWTPGQKHEYAAACAEYKPNEHTTNKGEGVTTKQPTKKLSVYYLFYPILQGKGKTKQEAWENAIAGFIANPGVKVSEDEFKECTENEYLEGLQ